MRALGGLNLLVALSLFIVTFSAAWPSYNLVGDRLNALVQRQNSATQPTTRASTTARGSTTGTARSSATLSLLSPLPSLVPPSLVYQSTTDTATGSDASATDEPSNTNSRNATKTTAIDPRLPPGGIQMITPAPIEGPQYYKVGDFVTFEWNYTSLSVTPSAIDVLAECSLNSATYTIAANMSVEETGKIIWDTGESATATNPFPVASYTLVIHDSSKDATDVPQAGYLGSYNQYVFGMYTPQPYVPLNEFRCATCGGAGSMYNRQALGVIGFTAAVTVLSFTWFANGLGAFS